MVECRTIIFYLYMHERRANIFVETMQAPCFCYMESQVVDVPCNCSVIGTTDFYVY